VSAYKLTPRDRAERAAARLLARLSPKTARRLAGKPVVLDGQTLDPHVQIVLKALERNGPGAWASLGAEAARAEVRRVSYVNALPVPPVDQVADITVPGPVGALRARMYRSPGVNGAGSQPALVYFHGGGFVFGDIETHDELCRTLCVHAQVTVISVEYRLAPEDPFPAAVNDAVAAFTWAHANAEQLGLDPDRIAVGGDSAGGNLSAVVCQQMKEAAGAMPAFQLLIYPKTSDEPTRSLELFANGFLLIEEDMLWFVESYGPHDGDPRAYPLLSPDLTGLPPAYVVTAGFDPLRDEGEAYAAALRAAGVPTALRRHESLIHGFANLTAVSQTSRDAVVEMAGALQIGLTSRLPA
jgi:acetyl esterase